MDGVTLFHRPPDPPDTLQSPELPLLPMDFPPLAGVQLSPGSTSPNYPSFPWGFKKKEDLSKNSESSLGSASTTLDVASTTSVMEISPPTKDPTIHCQQGLELTSPGDKEMALISAQYSTLSAKTKGQRLKSQSRSETTRSETVATNPKLLVAGLTAILGDKDVMFGSFAPGPEAPASSLQPPSLAAPKAPFSGSQPPLQPSIGSTNQPTSSIPPASNPSADSAAGNHKESNTWAGKARIGADRSLKRLAPTFISPNGVPQVKVPDEVFIRGAEAHRDYVLGVFTGKLPSFSQIQSVLTHIWGRGVKLQIHLRPASRSMLVKIPNDFIRNKVVEQEIWHIGSSLFYVVQWSAEVAASTPTMTSIPLWAHVRGVPFDLYTREGLSLVAGNIGHPVEADEFTIKMISLDVAHLKVRADCTKPLPDMVELVRQDGSIIPVSVTYPWVPHTCPCCHQLGHHEPRCPNARWAPAKSQDVLNKEKDASLPADIPLEANTHQYPPQSKEKLLNQTSQGHLFQEPLKTSTLVFGSQQQVFTSSKDELVKLAEGLSGQVIETPSSALELPPSSSNQLSSRGLSDSAVSTDVTNFSTGSSSGTCASEAGLALEKFSFQKPSKKRKGSQITRRGSPEIFPSKEELYPPASVPTKNPFACLDSLRQDLSSSTGFSETDLPPIEIVSDGTLPHMETSLAITLTSQHILPPGLPQSTPAMGSSPPVEEFQQ